MLRSKRIWLGVIVLLWASWGCKCGKDNKNEQTSPEKDYVSTVSKLPKAANTKVAEFIPQNSTVVLLSENLTTLKEWLDSRSWMQELKKTPIFQELHSSPWMLQIFTIKHRIESLSSVRFQQTKLTELLTTPIGIAIRKPSDIIEILIVKEINLGVQAMDRMVEVFNQVTPREGLLTSRDLEGLQLRELTMSDSHFYYLLFSNMLLLSNSEKFLMESVELGRGKSNQSVAQQPKMKELLIQEMGKYNLVGRLNLADEILFYFKAAEPPQLDCRILFAGDVEKIQTAPFLLGKMIPLDSRLVVGFADVDIESLWEDLADRLGEGILDKAIQVNFKTALLPYVENQLTVVVGGVDLTGSRPVPQLAILLKLNKTDGIEPILIKTFEYAFGKKPEKQALGSAANRSLYGLTEGQNLSPAFAVMGQWLVLGSTVEIVQKILSTSEGQQPALADVQGFSSKVLSGEKPYYLLSYFDGNAFFDDLKEYSMAIMKLGERFDATTSNETLSPIFESLRKMGKIGGAMTSKDAGVWGSLVPL